MCKRMRAVLPILHLLCQLQVQRRALTRRAQGLGSDDPSVTVFHESPASASTPSPSGGGRLHASLQGVAESPPLGKHAPKQLLVPAVLLPLSFRFLALACSFSCSPHTLIYTHAPIHTLTHPHAHTHTNTYTLICTLHTCVYDVPFCPFNRYLMHSVCLQWFPHLRAPLFLSSAQSELDELYRARQLPV